MRPRAIAGAILGVIVPLLCWLGTWFAIPPVTCYHDWFRAAHLPEWIMWPLVPWASIHLAIVANDNAMFRRLVGPVMFAVVVMGSIVVGVGLARAIDGTWGGHTGIGQTAIFVLSSLVLDAVPAVTAIFLGWCLARQGVRRRAAGPTRQA